MGHPWITNRKLQLLRENNVQPGSEGPYVTREPTVGRSWVAHGLSTDIPCDSRRMLR